MIVMKFGGTSVQDSATIANVCEIVSANLARHPLIVVSACAGVTNALLEVAETAAGGGESNALAQLAQLKTRHRNLANELLSDSGQVLGPIEDDFCELEKIIRGVSALKELTLRTLDQIAAYGELWSSAIFTQALRERGIAALLVDARTVMITDRDFTRAEPQFEVTRRKANQILLPPNESGQIVVTQGFIGSSEDGSSTTIGRGGSDYSASIFGAALKAEEIQIWTDVDGILTADPSILPEARLITEMTFDEAAELAYFGAKVLHPSTILPAIEKNIPVRVLNSKRPEGEGTLITGISRRPDECLLKSIAYKEGITVVTIKSTRMLMSHGFLARVFDTFARHKKSVDVVATSEVGISLTVDDLTQIDDIAEELREFAMVEVQHGKAVVCVVGENMKYTKGIAARIFTALSNADVNIELISHGGSDINLTFVIDEKEIVKAVQSLHEEFFDDVPVNGFGKDAREALV